MLAIGKKWVTLYGLVWWHLTCWQPTDKQQKIVTWQVGQGRGSWKASFRPPPSDEAGSDGEPSETHISWSCIVNRWSSPTLSSQCSSEEKNLRIACSATCFSLAAAVRIVASWKTLWWFKIQISFEFNSNDDKDDRVPPETCARWNESLEGKFARKANPLGWPVPPGWRDFYLHFFKTHTIANTNTKYKCKIQIHLLSNIVFPSHLLKDGLQHRVWSHSRSL